MTENERLILGVDGGGTSTVAWLADATNPSAVIGRGHGGPSNLQSVGPATAFANLEASIRSAFQDADSAVVPVAAACLGLAGAGRESDRQQVEAWANRVELTKRLTIVTDASLLLHAGHCDGAGIALIVGTGSLAFGQDASGRTARSGGWGYLLGDEGSGYAIAVDGLRASVRAADGRNPTTVLLDRFLATLKIGKAEDLIRTIYHPEMTRAHLANLASVVFEATLAGDSVANRIIDEAAVELAKMVESVAKQLSFTDQPIPLVLAGGIAVNQPILRERLRIQLAQLAMAIEAVVIVDEPVMGALAIAHKLLA